VLLLSVRSKVAVLSGLPANRWHAISDHFKSDLVSPDYTISHVRTNDGVSEPITFGSTLVQKAHVRSSAAANFIPYAAANVAANFIPYAAANAAANFIPYAAANVAANFIPYAAANAVANFIPYAATNVTANFIPYAAANVTANSTPHTAANAIPYVCVSPSVWFSVS